MNNRQAALIASAAMHAGDKYETNHSLVLRSAQIFEATLDKWDRDDAEDRALDLREQAADVSDVELGGTQ